MDNINTKPSIPDIPTVKLEPRKLNFREKVSNLLSKISPANKILKGTLGFLILTASIGVGVYLTQNVQKTTTQAGTASLILSTNKTQVNIGDTVIVAVAIDTKGMSVTGTDLKVRYDPAILEAQSIVPKGNFLPEVLVPEKIYPNFGRADIMLGCVVNEDGAQPKSGIGLLAEVTFIAKAPGTAAVSFGNASAVAAVGQGGDVKGDLNTINITVGTSQGATTTPTSTPGATTIASPTASTNPGITSSSPSPEASASSCTKPSIPTANLPTGTLACSSSGTSSVTFQWSAIEGAGAYALRINDTSNGYLGCTDNQNPGDHCITGITSNSYTIDLPVGKSYQWWVSAISCGIQSDNSNTQTFTLPPSCQ